MFHLREAAVINIRELASLAGVSIATVSRVINNPQLVQPDTREHVLEVMRQVNYSPAWTVESRLSGRSRLIAFLFSEADYYFYSDIRRGLESIAGLRSYTVLYCPISAEPQRRSQQLRTIFEQKLDGAIWALRDFYPEDIKMIDERQVPLVLARKYDSAPTDRYNCCYINFAEASYRMTRHLLEMGHRRIGLMFENVSQQFMSSFCQGWELALKEEAAPRESELLLNAPNSMAGGYAKTMELLERGKMPEAVFCASDEQAFGVLKAAHEKGVRVPEELAVAGFTDSPMSNLCDPELTTIDLPIYRLGIIAARMLFDVIEDIGSEMTAGEVVLQPKLRIRRSCGNEKPINVLFE